VEASHASQDGSGPAGHGPDGLAGDRSRLRLLSIIAPASFVALVVVATALLVEHVPALLLIPLGILTATAGAGLFAAVIFRVIEQGEAGLLERNEQLAALQTAAMALAAEFDLRGLLQRFVERSREITGARYGAMSVLDADGGIAEFITSGLSDQERAAIGDPPVGRGLLGVIIREGRALRLDDIEKDGRSAGFPPHHPPMRSLLGVPVISRGRTIGNLYLTNKHGGGGFTDADEELVRTFAAHAAVAVETSRLNDELRLLAVLRERERIGMDLHDGIIQSIYAIALGLESALEGAERDPAAARASMDDAIERLNNVIRDVRSYIFELRPSRLSYDFSEAVARMVEEFSANAAMAVETDIAPALPALSDEQERALFHITHEALANSSKHAGARAVHVSLRPDVNCVRLTVRDDGRGFETDGALPAQHRGLRNMAARAAGAGGTFRVRSAPGQGTSVEVELPIAAREGAPA
jgi:signal transduction histidine kinase